MFLMEEIAAAEYAAHRNRPFPPVRFTLRTLPWFVWFAVFGVSSVIALCLYAERKQPKLPTIQEMWNCEETVCTTPDCCAPQVPDNPPTNFI